MVAKGVLFFLLTAAVVISGCIHQPSGNTAPASGSQILIKDYSFSPQELTVKAGTTVTWTNGDAVAHSIRSSVFNSGTLGPGDTFGYMFNAIGTYGYNCGIHPYMSGKIIVTG